jgi:pimeloyl-ACP methyl ester carboxylesterase
MSNSTHPKYRVLARSLCAVVAITVALLGDASASQTAPVRDTRPTYVGARTVHDSAWQDPSPHTALTVAIASDVSLEVLDWGGRGRAVVLLAGLGNTAHIFDDFAPQLARFYHVYGITRRGYGASSAPPSGYTSDRLAEDVVAVIDLLGIDRPILVGHSIAGDEMTVLGIEHPNKVAGLVYLEAAYDRTAPSFATWNALAGRTKPPPPTPEDQRSYSALRSWYVRTMHVDPPEADLRAGSVPSPMSPIGVPRTPPSVFNAVLAGVRKPDYSGIHVPALAIYAIPRSIKDMVGFGSASEPVLRELFRLQREQVQVNAAAFRSGNRHARVIEIPGATHFLFLSNPTETLRDIRAFVTTLR